MGRGARAGAAVVVAALVLVAVPQGGDLAGLAAGGLLPPLLLLGLWLPDGEGTPGRWWRHVAVLLAAGLLAAIHLPLGRWLARPLLLPPGAGNASSAVVLASGIYRSGEPSFSCLQRVGHAADLLAAGRVSRLVFSTSALVHESGAREAAAVASLVRRLGLPAAAVEVIGEGTTTREEAAALAARLLPRGERRILLVTNGPHIRRAVRVFEAAGFDVVPAPVQTTDSIDSASESRLRLFHYALHEWLGLVWYRLRGDIARL